MKRKTKTLERYRAIIDGKKWEFEVDKKYVYMGEVHLVKDGQPVLVGVLEKDVTYLGTVEVPIPQPKGFIHFIKSLFRP